MGFNRHSAPARVRGVGCADAGAHRREVATALFACTVVCGETRDFHCCCDARRSRLSALLFFLVSGVVQISYAIGVHLQDVDLFTSKRLFIADLLFCPAYEVSNLIVCVVILDRFDDDIAMLGGAKIDSLFRQHFTNRAVGMLVLVSMVRGSHCNFRPDSFDEIPLVHIVLGV